MANKAKLPVSWHQLSETDRYRRLRTVGHEWFRTHKRPPEDVRGRTVHLDGQWISDVPSFYLALGEAVNGPNGYIGWNIGALEDCLTAGFGVNSPLTVRLSHFDEVRNALNSRATLRDLAEIFHRLVEEGYSTEDIIEHYPSLFGDGSEGEIERLTALYKAALVGEHVECDEYPPYFDYIMDVFARRGSELVPDNEEVE